MVEVVEYALVILASSVLACFSFAALTSFSAATASAAFQSAFSAVSRGALNALAEGNSSVTAVVSDAAISCNGSALEFVSSGHSGGMVLPAGCSFEFSGLNGMKTFQFTLSGGMIDLRVS